MSKRGLAAPRERRGIVVGMKQGRGLYRGVLGRMEVMGENGVVWSVGEGFTMQERKRFWEYRKLFKGRKVRLGFGRRKGKKGVFFMELIT